MYLSLRQLIPTGYLLGFITSFWVFFNAELLISDQLFKKSGIGYAFIHVLDEYILSLFVSLLLQKIHKFIAGL